MEKETIGTAIVAVAVTLFITRRIADKKQREHEAELYAVNEKNFDSAFQMGWDSGNEHGRRKGCCNLNPSAL